MLSYRTHVYSCAMLASAEATKLALSLSECVTQQRRCSDPEAILDQHLPALVSYNDSLRSAVDVFKEALPAEADNWSGATELSAHLWWLNKRLNERLPGACVGDPVDIASNDIPKMLEEFETWYEEQSPTHTTLGARLDPHISDGQLNSALREAWVVFKKMMVEKFGLSESLDGVDLAKELFGDQGATSGILTNSERVAYLNLFQGLYVLSRNPVSHNDLPINPEVTSAVLALINSTVLRIEEVKGELAPKTVGHRFN